MTAPTLKLLPPGVHVAPYQALCRRPILLAIGAGSVLLASVVLVDDADEPRLRAELERLVRLHDGDAEFARCVTSEEKA